MARVALIRASKKSWRRPGRHRPNLSSLIDVGSCHNNDLIIQQRVGVGEKFLLACSIYNKTSGLTAAKADEQIESLIQTLPHFASATQFEYLLPLLPQVGRYAFRYKKILDSHYLHNQTCCCIGCSNPSIWSHTIPRQVLKQLAGGDPRILRIKPSADGTELAALSEGPVSASTFKGFCNDHDATIFSEVENSDYTGSYRQHLLVAYRCAWREYRIKLAAIRAQAKIADDLALQFSSKSQEFSRNELAVHACDVGNKVLMQLTSAKFVKQQIDLLHDEIFGSNVNKSFCTIDIEVVGSPPIASWGMASPEYDFNGNYFNVGNNFSNSIAYLSIHPICNGYILSITVDRSSDCLRPWTQSIANASLDRFGKILVPFVFAHAELTYFKQSLWKSLSDDVQAQIKRLAFTLAAQRERLPAIASLHANIKSILYTNLPD